MFDFVRVRFPDSPLEPERVYSLELHHKNYAHDFAKLQFRDWNIDPKQVKPGTPMEIVIQGKSYPGYVHDIRPKINSKSNFTSVSFIGASYVMRQASQKVYRNVTADEVVRQVASKYGFAYKLEPHPRVYSQLSQAGLTDWEFLVKLAKQIGYFLRAEGTTLVFQPLLQDFDDLITESQAFYQIDAGFKTESPMYEFRAVAGETLGHEGANKAAVSVAGVDPVTGQLFKYTKQNRSETTRASSQPELFDAHATRVVANNYQIAVSEATSADDKSRFPYIAEALVLGDSSLRPGMPVYLHSTAEEYTGYWTILEVEHSIVEERLNVQRYTTSLTVGTDSLGKPVGKYPSQPPARPYRAIKPNVKNTRVRARSVIKSSNIKVKPTQPVGLVDRINRPAPSGKLPVKTTWASDRSNLKGKPKVPGRSPAALTKVLNFLDR